MPKIDLTNPVIEDLFRTSLARGLKSEGSPVERDGGDEGVGLIRGMALITRGEALGHDFWIDRFMVGQVTDAVNATGKRGIKSRFTHPGMSEDGLGKRLGQVKTATVDNGGDISRGDLHFTKASHNSPSGDLAEYVMDLADEAPTEFGNSIAFMMDWDATFEHWKANGGEDDRSVMRAFFYGYGDRGNYKTDDPLNEKNLLHVRLMELRAVDTVDDPAANPGGLFHSNPIPVEADGLLSYAMGLKKERPQSSLFNVNPDRMAGYFQKFLQNHNLQVVQKGDSGMAQKQNLQADPKPESTNPPAAEPAPAADATPAAAPAGDGTEAAASETPAAAETSTAQTPEQLAQAKLGKYVAKFGSENGGKWFSEGKSYEEALELHGELISTQLSEANRKIEAAQLGAGEATPVSAGDATDKGTSSSGEKLSGRKLLASTIKMPGTKK